MNEYLKAKWRLVLLTKEDGLAIIEYDVLKRAIHLGLSLPKCKICVIGNAELPESFPDFPETSPSNLIFNKIDQGIHLPVALYQALKPLSIAELLPSSRFSTAKISYDKSKNSAQINLSSWSSLEEPTGLTARSTETYLDPAVKPRDDNAKSRDDNNNIFINNSCLPGEHNLTNILNASLIAKFIGIPMEIIFKQWEKETSSYAHLPHRLEFIGNENQIFVDSNKKKKHVIIVNDSKATNVESTLVALKSFNKPIRLLIGGEAKGDSYLPIVHFIEKNVIAIYPFGKAASTISEQLNRPLMNEIDGRRWEDVLLPDSPNMLAAANQALLESNEGDLILLSPACSSFDEFKNFEFRGDTFRTWAISCFEENNS